MEQLTALDAAFLEAEDSDSNVSLAVGALSIIDGPIPDYAAILDSIGERAATLPRLMQIVRTKTLAWSTPEWVDDDDFQILRHVRRAAVPQPGDDGALFGVVADLMERRLDRHRPLWECWIIDGLHADRWAILFKVHHCIADGIAATQLLTSLSDDSHSDSFAGRIRAAKEPPRQGIRMSDLSLNPVVWVNRIWRTSTALTSAATQALSGALQIAGGLLDPTTSSLTGHVTGMRRYASTHVGLHDVARICHAFDVTINDVALAAITDSYRAAMIRRGEHPSPESLRTLVPVSVRSPDAIGAVDNRVSAMLPCLPVDEYDPIRQLQAVHRRLAQAKGSGQRQAGSVFVAAANLLPFGVTAWGLRALSRLPQRGVVTVATNVPGPRRPLQVLGRRVIRVVPLPPIALGLRTGIAILSYAEDLVFGITADYEAVPDVDELAAGIQRAIMRLAALSESPHRGIPNGSLAGGGHAR
jgi:diacylglycerol O-acyltransferase